MIKAYISPVSLQNDGDSEETSEEAFVCHFFVSQDIRGRRPSDPANKIRQNNSFSSFNQLFEIDDQKLPFQPDEIFEKLSTD